MIFNLKKITKLIKRNAEIVFLFFLLTITITTTTLYNNHKVLINENYKDVISKDIKLIVQIEHIDAVNNLDEILTNKET